MFSSSQAIIHLFVTIIVILTSGVSISGETYKFERSWPALRQPWYFDMPSDVAVDGNGYVYVVDTGNHRIRKFTRGGQFVTEWGNGNLDKPDGIAIDQDGLIYISDTRFIKKFNSNGLFISQWGVDESFEPSGIAIGDDGFLYTVNLDTLGICKFTRDGKLSDQWGRLGDDVDKMHCGIATDTEGCIYVSNYMNDCIRKFDSDGNPLEQWRADGNFDNPSGLAVCKDGFIYVSDSNNDRIQKFSTDGKYICEWGNLGARDGEFNAPLGIAVDGEGFVYVSDKLNRRIQKFTTEGDFVSGWKSRGDGNGEFILPQGITFGIDDQIYVVDKNNHRVQLFTEEGRYLTQWGQEGDGEGEFKYPHGIATDSNGFVYVADTSNNRIQKFGADGSYDRKWGLAEGTAGSGEGEFNHPTDIAVDKNNNIYVVDWKNNRIQKFDSEGNHIRWGNVDTEFERPFGIAIDKAGFIYVTDYYRIQKFDEVGNSVPEWGRQGSLEGFFQFPSGIAIDGQGNVLFANAENNRVQKFDSQGNFIRQFSMKGSNPGQFCRPRFICAGENGLIYVTDSENNRIQVLREIETPEGVSKAIIVAGGGPYPGNNLWDATQTCANFAYSALVQRGFTNETIQYLSSNTEINLDGNDMTEDVDGVPSQANLEYAVTDWANDADTLLIYLVDHGGQDNFRLTGTEILNAGDLKGWLDSQSFKVPKVIMVYDACHAENFLSRFTNNDGRILIAGTSRNENSHFINQGTISFSWFFWSGIFNGDSLGVAFENAETSIKSITRNQNPILDASSNGSWNEPDDYDLVRNLFLGGSTIAGDKPIIRNPILLEIPGSSGDFALTAEVSDNNGLARVWAMLIPDHTSVGEAAGQPLLQIPSVDLLPVGGNRYEGRLAGPELAGKSRIVVYASDRTGNMSQPAVLPVDHDFSKRLAVIVACCSVLDASWPEIEKNVSTAYNTLKFQGYSDEDIYFLSPVTYSTGFDGIPDSDNIEYAVKGRISENCGDLVLYLVGTGLESGIWLNENETLSVSELDSWLDEVQIEYGIKITVVIDAEFSGTWLPYLAPPENSKRILIAEPSPDGIAVSQADNEISFSAFFWKEILKGIPVGISFSRAKDTIEMLAGSIGRQTPLLDDNGNGIGNDPEDGDFADSHVIGVGIKLAENAPVIGSIIPTIVLEAGNTVTIWAEDITSVGGVKSVRAVVHPPNALYDQSHESYSVSETFELKDNGNGRYEGTYDGIDPAGEYRIIVYARDEAGHQSQIKETLVRKTGGPDVYETDDSMRQASFITINDDRPQQHNFHTADDEDWVRFYGLSGSIYELAIDVPNEINSITAEIYNSDSTPIVSNEISRSDDVVGDERIPVWTLMCNETTVYFIRLHSVDTDSNGAIYGIRIYQPHASLPGFLTGILSDACSGYPITNALIRTNGGMTDISRPNGRYRMILEPGTYAITVEATGYYPMASPNAVVSEGVSTILNLELDPVATQPEITDSNPTAMIDEPENGILIHAGDSIEFRGNVTDGDAPFEYSWDFGGISQSDQLNPGFVAFPNAGEYTVAFIVTDADGDMARASVGIQVIKAIQPKPLEARIESRDLTVETGQTVDFNGTVSGGMPPYTYLWSFGGVSDSNVEDPGNIKFMTAGDYQVVFTVSDLDNNTDSDSVAITVTDPVIVTEPEIKPISMSPADGNTDVSLTPELRIGFSNPSGRGFAHFSTQWQISRDQTFSSVVFNHVSISNLYSFTIPDSVLDRNTDYFWRTKISENDDTTQWSDVCSFHTTSSAFDDSNSNGIPDEQEIESSAVNFINAGDNDIDAHQLKCVRTVIGNTKICIAGSENVRSLVSVRSIEQIPNPEDTQKPKDMPLGCITYKFSVNGLGGSAKIVFHFSKPLPQEAAWYHYDLVNGLQEVAVENDGNSVEMTVKDGGFRDADGVKNGYIVGISGISTDQTQPVSPKTSHQNDVGGVDCFIKSVFSAD